MYVSRITSLAGALLTLVIRSRLGIVRLVQLILLEQRCDYTQSGSVALTATLSAALPLPLNVYSRMLLDYRCCKR